MTRLFVLDTRWAERACAISCRHRSAAGWLTAVVQPSLPIPVARAVSLHTWPAFRDAMRHLVITTDWRQLLGEVADHGIPIGLTYGTCDLVGGHAHAMSRAIPGVTVTLIPGAGHHLPMSQPELCMAQITPKHDGTHEG